MSVGLTLTTTGQTLVHPDAGRSTISGAYAVLLVASSVSLFRRQAHARRFLEAYPDLG